MTPPPQDQENRWALELTDGTKLISIGIPGGGAHSVYDVTDSHRSNHYDSQG